MPCNIRKIINYENISQEIVKASNLDQIYLSSDVPGRDFSLAHMSILINLTYLENAHQLKQNSEK